MSLITIDWSPDDRKLRQFGWAGLAGFSFLACLTAIRSGAFHGAASLTPSIILWVCAALCGLLALVRPRLLKPLFIALTVITFPIGLVMNFVILSIVYFGLFVPLGLVFRIMGRDALNRRLDPAAVSYWTLREPMPDAGRYYRQY